MSRFYAFSPLQRPLRFSSERHIWKIGWPEKTKKPEQKSNGIEFWTLKSVPGYLKFIS